MDYADSVDQHRVFLFITNDKTKSARGKSEVCQRLGTRIAVDDRFDNCLQLCRGAGVLPYQVWDPSDAQAREFHLPRNVVEMANTVDAENRSRVYRHGQVRHFAFSDHKGEPGSGFERVCYEIVSECEQRTIYPKITAAYRCSIGSQTGR